MMTIGEYEYSILLVVGKCSNINDIMICGIYEEYKINSSPYAQQYFLESKNGIISIYN